jgi:hypothetical protein
MYEYLIISVLFRGCGFDRNIQMSNISKDDLNAYEPKSNNPEMALMKIARLFPLVLIGWIDTDGVLLC